MNRVGYARAGRENSGSHRTDCNSWAQGLEFLEERRR